MMARLTDKCTAWPEYACSHRAHGQKNWGSLDFAFLSFSVFRGAAGAPATVRGVVGQNWASAHPFEEIDLSWSELDEQAQHIENIENLSGGSEIEAVSTKVSRLVL